MYTLKTKILTEDMLRGMIRGMLLESMSSTVYHFTSMPGLYGILTTNRFKLKTSMWSGAESGYSNRHMFYLSTTRNRNSDTGYGRDVRIELDGDMLNQNYSGKAIDYWGASMGMHSYMDGKRGGIIPYKQTSSETEDRVLSKKPFISDAYKYIKRVDILLYDKIKDRDIYDENRRNVKYILEYFGGSMKISVYDNKKDYNHQTENTVNRSLLDDDSIKPEKMKSNPFDQGLDALSSLITLMIAFEVDNIQEYISGLCRKYGLGLYKDALYKMVKRELSRGWTNMDDISDWLYKMKYLTDLDDVAYSNAARMLHDYCKSHGFSNMRDIIKHKKYLMDYGRNTTKNLDWGKKVAVLVNNNTAFGFDTEHFNKIVLHPEKDSVFDVSSCDKKTLMYQLDMYMSDGGHSIYHNSKDDGSFMRYFKHQLDVNPSVKNIYSILKSVGISKQDIQSYFCIFLYTKELGLWQVDDSNFINAEEKKEFYSMFIPQES